MARKRKLRILVSVFDKTGLVEFIKQLSQIFSLEIISTGGTAKHLTRAGLKVKPVEKITHSPQILSGRVKTLHPQIFGAILADKSNPRHLKELKQHLIKTFDLVVVNLYPFAATIKKKSTTLKQAIEQIDIGGVALLRAAAKNYSSVIVMPSPHHYSPLIKLLQKQNHLPASYRKKLAAQTFALTSSYDRLIANYLS
jgi:phosphoribosylaminoimidazolecarboxamide formyltransferase/IMP cyclohydrolase